jgi:hypothetical protein
MATNATQSKPKPAGVCRLTVTIRGTSYTARPVNPQASDVARAWRLRRADGAVYTVADTEHGPSCDCGDFVWRHDGKDATGCKHVKSLRALGLLDPEGEGQGAESWPDWTDGVRSSTNR